MKQWMENNKVIIALTFFAAVIIPILSFLDVKPPCITNCKPEFVFEYEGTGEPVYEVGEGMVGLYESDVLEPFSITISVPSYRGDRYNGAVDVFAEKSDEMHSRIRLGGWSNFRNEYQTPATLSLMPGQLFDFARLPRGIDAYSWNTQQKDLVSGTFDLVVMYTDGTELARETVTVRHTPWYHQTYLSGSVIQPDEDVRVIVKVNNLGQPGRFRVSLNLYDTINPDLDSLINPDGWWVGMTWVNGTTYGETQVIQDKVAPFHSGEMEFTIPETAFEAGHIYTLETVAYKELPYLKFKKDDWSSSPDRWRYKDHSEFQTIIIIE